MIDTTTELGRLRRHEQLQLPMIKRLMAKYDETGNKKYLHALRGLGIDVDYDESDVCDEPRGYN